MSVIFETRHGRPMTADQAACHVAAQTLLEELKCRSGPMAGSYPMTEHEVELRVALETLRREMCRRSGEPGYEEVPA